MTVGKRRSRRPLAVFRCDGSAAIGGGHVRRCLTLAAALAEAGWARAFAVREETLAVIPGLAEAVDQVAVLDGPIEDEPARIAEAFGDAWDLLVVDHYRRDCRFETACRQWAERILVIDDLADRRHDADLLLDQTFGRKRSDYTQLVPPHCRVLAGSRYALVRPTFATRRRATLARREQGRPVSRILVAVGATDADNVTGIVLEGIYESGLSAAVDVVLGAGAPHLPAVSTLAAAMPQRTRVHVDCENIAELMAGADIAVGAGGTTSWERCCLGLPSVVIITAENQALVAERLAAAGACTSIGRHRDVMPAMVARAVTALADDAGRRRAMARAAAAICDGRGVKRLLSELGFVTDAKRGTIALRPASMDDAELMLVWQRDPRTRQFALNPDPPQCEEHYKWLTKRLGDPRTIFNIIVFEGKPAGVVRLDKKTIDGIGEAYEVSIFVAPNLYRRGVASGGLALSRELVADAVLVARVKSGNTASEALFARAGYTRDNGWLVNRSSDASARGADPVGEVRSGLASVSPIAAAAREHRQ
jgi:UDP-2,4-diacetamido-2,4,6-trideoxy-beta-L-altropyranose hydrolase